MKTGNERSLRTLTEDLTNSQIFEDIEKKILNGDVSIGFNIRFDGRAR